MDPTLIATLLSLLSALTLAIVNAAVKKGGDILAGRAILSISAAAMLLPVAFFVPMPNEATWIGLAFSVPAHWAYQAALIRAMSRGDLSLVFPIMRGLAPLLTAGTAFIILGESFSALALGGLIAATLAVISFTLPPGGGSIAKHPDRVALTWAGLTAVGIALYNVADAYGVRAAPTPLTFIVWLFLLDWIGITLMVLIFRRGALVSTLRTHWKGGLLAGFLSVISFGASLWALDMMEAARVSALRETAVVFAALLGWLFLKEGFGPRRAMAAAALAAGLVLMQLG